MPSDASSSSVPAQPPLSADLAWLEEGGELGKLISHYPWETTPLGPLQRWPQSLRTAVSLMLNSQHPMWIGWGAQMTFLYNDAYISVLSRSKHPWALGRPAAEVWSEIWDVCGPLADKVFQHGQASFLNDVQLFMKRDGFVEETYYSFSYSPIRDESGRVGGLFCPSAEVSAKVLNARRLGTLSELSANALLEKTVLRACETAFSTLGKNSRDLPFASLYLFEAKGKALDRVQQLGLTAADDEIAPPVVDLSSGNPAPLWPFLEVLQTSKLAPVLLPTSAALPEGAANQRISTAVLLPVAARGHDRPFGFFISGVNPARPLDQEYRTFYELIAGQIATAIQNARAAEEQRQRAEELAELDRAKTTFFSNVSHELRTPLTLMLGPLEELTHRNGRSPEDLSMLAEVAQRNGLRLLKLVNTLLDFSRLEAGRLQGRFEAVNLGAYTADIASAFRSAIEHGGLKFIVDLPTDFEPAYIDPGLWEKIILNLLSNALKFTLHGEIAIRLRQDQDAFVLEVKDTGIGIATEAQARLFERFYRVEGSRGRTQEGTGIGLALVQDLVKLHGGTIRAESAVGVGTSFIVKIPRGRHHLPPDRLSKEHRGASAQIANQFVQEATRWDAGRDEPVSILGNLENLSAAPSSEHVRTGQVLLVDDNADMRDYVARLLSERFDVLTAQDGEAALEVLKHARPDLILSDVMMPRLDGFGLIRAVRAHPEWRTLPVILLSARAGDEARLEGVNESADDYLVKPFSARELLARVSTHLELARVRHESERKVREADERVRLALEASGVGAWTWEVDAETLRGDANVFRLFSFDGRDGDSVPLKTFLPKIHPDDLGRVSLALEEAAGGQRNSFEEDYRIIQPDGSHRWVASRGRIRAREIHRVFSGVLIDITERKELERENARLYQDVQATIDRLNFSLESLALGYWTWEAKNDIIVCSPRMLDIYGWEATGTTTREDIRRLVHPDDRQRTRDAAQRSVETASDYDIEYRVIHPTRGLRWVAAKGRPVFDPSRAFTGMMGVVQDVTERKQAELHLLKQKDVLEQIVVGTELTDILESLTRWIEDFADRKLVAVVLLTDVEQKSLRFAAGERCPQLWRRRLDGGLIHSARDSAAAALVKHPIAVAAIERDPHWESFRADAAKLGYKAAWDSPILSSADEALGTISVYYFEETEPSSHERDLVEVATRTASIAIERKRAEEALRASRARVEQHAEELEKTVADRTVKLRETIGELEAFSYTISHDMRAPLRAMHGYAELLIEDFSRQLPEEGQLYLERLRKNAVRLELLVRDVLAYSKVAKEEVQLTPVPLDNFLTLLLEQMQELQTAGVKVRVHSPLPTVLGHEAYLSQIFTNLLSNALKFARRDEPLTIEIAARIENGMARVSVRDNGIGIAPEHYARIFEIFGRVYPDKMYEGTGIGLSIVKKAVHRLGGTAGVESKVGQGSDFWFTLRLA